MNTTESKNGNDLFLFVASSLFASIGEWWEVFLQDPHSAGKHAL